jgi:gp16 family phage-associated protein
MDDFIPNCPNQDAQPMTYAKQAKRRTAAKNSRKAAAAKPEPAAAPRTVRCNRVVTRDDARAQLSAQGLSVAQWAKQNGVAYDTARKVLQGHNVGQFGEAHKVAVLLRLKRGTAVL